jgi:hypothetical protein
MELESNADSGERTPSNTSTHSQLGLGAVIAEMESVGCVAANTNNTAGAAIRR